MLGHVQTWRERKWSGAHTISYGAVACWQRCQILETSEPRVPATALPWLSLFCRHP